MTYQDITNTNNSGDVEALFVADETNCVQWIWLRDVEKFGAEEPDIPFMGRCEMDCDWGTTHRWRKVMVLV